MPFDARVDVTRAVVVQGITDAVAKADLVSPIGQPEGLREDALPSKPFQVVRFIQRDIPVSAYAIGETISAAETAAAIPVAKALVTFISIALSLASIHRCDSDGEGCRNEESAL